MVGGKHIAPKNSNENNLKCIGTLCEIPIDMLIRMMKMFFRYNSHVRYGSTLFARNIALYGR